MIRLAATLLLLLGCAHAQTKRGTSEPPAEHTLSPEQVVRFSIASPSKVARGSLGEVVVTLRIATGYHVMSDQPSNPLYIATRVRFDPSDGLAWQPATYPTPRSFRLAAETISTFEGELVVRVSFQVAADATPGTRDLTGTLEYQSCTRTSCLFPVKRPLAARVEIAP